MAGVFDRRGPSIEIKFGSAINRKNTASIRNFVRAKDLPLGEDSFFELKAVEFRGNRVIGPRRDAMADELAAMANTVSGGIVLGVDDKSREILGIPHDKIDILETWIREICSDSIDPPLFCTLRKLSIPGSKGDQKIILRIDVPRSLFVHKSPNGYFQRVGSSKREMKPDVLARLFQQRSQARLVRFDEQIVPGTSPKDLNPGLWQRFKTVLSPPDDIAFLEKISLITKDEEGVLLATVGGVLMASDRPEDFLFGAFIQAVCYRGTERNELITSLLARCPMNVEATGSTRSYIMDKRGEGVPIIITESRELSGKKPEYRLLDDAELKLTIFAAPEPDRGR